MSDTDDEAAEAKAKAKKAEPEQDDEEVLDEARQLYADAEDALSEIKQRSLDDVKFGRLGEQWDASDQQQRKIDGRPCLTVNDLPASIRQVVNDGRQNRPAIKVRPVDSGADVPTADVFSGLIKHIESISDADVAYDTALDTAVSGTFGFIGVEWDYSCDDTFDMDIKIRTIPNPLAVTWDWRAEKVDLSDARFAFITEAMDKKEFEKKYPDAKSDAVDFADGGHIDGWFTEDSVRLAQYYKREEIERTLALLSDGSVVDKDDYTENKDLFDMLGATVVRERPTRSYQIIHRLISGRDILDEKRWRGSIIPLTPVWGEMINVEGKWQYKSLITDAKDSQRMFNLSRSTVTEMVGRSPKVPWLGEEGVFDADPDKWPNVNTVAHPFIEYSKGQLPPQRIAPPDVPTGLIQEAMAAADDKKRIMGIHDASLGVPGNEISGKAIRYRQHEGDTSTFHFIDNQHRAIRTVGRVLIEMIPQVYSTARIVRILGDDGKPNNVAIAPSPRPQIVKGQVVQPPPPAPPPGFEKVYDLTVGKYDLTVEAGPSYTTRREEAADVITTFIGAAPQSAMILGPQLVKMMDFPDSEKISRMMATMMPPAARQIFDGTPMPPPGPPPELQAQMAAAQAQAQHDQQLQQQKAQQQFDLEKQSSANKLQIEQTQAAADMATMRQKAELEMDLMRQRAALEAELKRSEAQMAAELKMAGAATSQMNAPTTATISP